MLLTIHDASLQKVAFVDNDKQNTLNYYDDTWTRDLPTGSSTFEFTVFKKAIKSDTALSKAYQYLNERAWVSFRYHGRTYLFNVMTVEENEQTIKCYCENLNLDLINEHANSYKAERAMSFIEYCQEMGLLGFSNLSVGINEISDRRRTLEWEGQDTNLARLLSLANKFDAEIEFETHLNADSSIKSFRVNVYQENDENHQGVGRVRNDIQLTYGKNLTSITRKVDKTGIFNAIRPTGKRRVKNEKGEEVEEVVTLRELEPWSVMRDGNLEFYQRNESLYAPISMQMYPSVFSPNTFDDQWIRKDFSYETDNPKELRRLAYNELKKHCYPAVTYEVNGFIDVEIGDTIKIYDNGFNPSLMIQARVSEQKVSFTNPASNKTTFSNFKALENKLSDGIQAAFERLFEASKPYIIKLATDKGVIFKNGDGESTVTATLYKGGKPVVAGVTWRWALDGNVSTGMSYVVRGSSVRDTSTLTVAAYIDNNQVAVDEISFANVLDGKLGTPGTPGRDGRNGADGRTQYTHIAYSNSADGTKDFSVSASDRAYIGIYVDFNSADSNTPSDYNWTLVKGSDGANGVAGKAGADGRTPYLHIAYATSNNGSQGFSTTDSTNKTYIGTYTDYTQADSTDYRVYKWTLIKGADGTGISNVTNYYLVTTVSTGITRASAGWTTTPQPITSDKRYLWNYRVELYTNGTSKTTEPTVIGVHGEKGERGLQGDQGIPGIRGTDGRTQYTHIAYADNAVGGGFSQTNTNKPYIGMYVDFNAADSNNPTVYKWTKWKGEDGAQGVPGAKGADGRTPYFHRAWSNSADGRDGFSTTDSTNKRYLGTLTDFTESDSQNPAHYKWTALFGTTEQSGNILLNSNTGWRNKHQQDFILAEPLKAGKQYTLSARWWRSDNSNLNFGIRKNSSDSWQWINLAYSFKLDVWSATFTADKNLNAGDIVSFFTVEPEGVGNADWAVLTVGAIPITSWQPHWSETQKQLDSKADQGLTQEQLNALSEKSQILEAEMKAKASMEAFSELEKAYNAFVDKNAKDAAQSEKDLIEAGRRIDLLTTQFGGLAELKTFIDTYMKSTNEGLIIGKNDASSTIKVSSDRISMFSAGKEVMYISQGVINIDNGIFTASVQIGRFRTEQYHLDKDVNVIRYVG
jgi:phage minor structural protein